MPDEYLSLSQAAEMLDVSRMTLSRLAASGRLASFEDNLDRRRVLVRRSDIEAMRGTRIQLREIPSKQTTAGAAAA